MHFDKGRWQWGWAPVGAQPYLCPACRRIEDNLPDGLLTLHGVPPRLKDQAEDAVVVQTTDIHLPRRIGEAVKHAYRGTLDMHFDDDGYFARVRLASAYGVNRRSDIS